MLLHIRSLAGRTTDMHESSFWKPQAGGDGGWRLIKACEIDALCQSSRNLNEWARGALSLKSVNIGKETMKAILGIACVLAISVAIFPFEASAQGRGGGMGGGMGGGLGASSSQGGGLTGLDRADQAAGVHGAQGRAIARTRGANAKAFCPPGQRKKAGLGSRFRC
jgi:hypothetical protein